MNTTKRLATTAATLILGAAAAATTYACDLKIHNAWIREAPPNMMTVAGYAQLTNTGKKPLEISKVESPTFMEVQLHESTLHDGVAGMRQLDKLIIPVNGSVSFEPHGKHFMMMGMKHPLKSGDTVMVDITDDRGCISHTEFAVRKELIEDKSATAEHSHHTNNNTSSTSGKRAP